MMILDLIYPFGYLASLTGLVFWFFFQDNRRLSRMMSALFLTGFFVYLLALSFSSGTLSYKLMILFRDMLVLGVISQLTNILKKNVYAFITLLVACACVLYFSYFRILQNTFPQVQTKDFHTSAEFLVELHADASPDIFRDLKARYNLEITQAFAPQYEDRTDLDDYYSINVPDVHEKQLKRIYGVLDRLEGVEWLEGNDVISLDFPAYAEKLQARSEFFLNDPGLEQQWAFEPMEVNALHRHLAESGVKPQKTARIFILDTGIDAGHEDLARQYRSYKQKHDRDLKGHGTHCAGIAAAVSNNGKGIASYAPSESYVEVTSIRVLNDYGVGSQKGIIDGMISAADAGADVISLSLGGRSIQRKQKAYRAAVRYANDQGAIVVVAAGNQNKSAKSTAPANVPGVITVAALGPDLDKAPFSNTVEDVKMGIAAPGVQIYSTIPGNQYTHFNGTSMATPYVSGLVALMKSFHPDLTTEEAFLVLQETGKKTPAGTKTGYLIQPYKAVLEMLD